MSDSSGYLRNKLVTLGHVDTITRISPEAEVLPWKAHTVLRVSQTNLHEIKRRMLFERGSRLRLIIVNSLAILTALVTVSNALSVAPKLGQAYYFPFAFALIFFLVIELRNLFLSPLFTLIIPACGLSLIANEVPAIFRSDIRFGIFILMLALLTPLVASPSLLVYRKQLFLWVQMFTLIASVMSAPLYIIGLNLTGEDYFGGLFNNSIIMGAASASSILYVFHLRMGQWWSTTSFKWIRNSLFIVVQSLLGMILLVAASRASISALAISLIFYFGRQFGGVKFISLAIIVVIAVLAFLPMLEHNLLQGLLTKGGGDFRLDYTTREHLWIQRWNEFTTNYWFGIGFASVADIGSEASSVDDSGAIEPGSSWLALLAMTGLVGFIPVASAFLATLKKTFFIAKWERGGVGNYLAALLIFWSIHMLAEGYLLAAGSFLFAQVWLLTGTIDSYYHSSHLSLKLRRNGTPVSMRNA